MIECKFVFKFANGATSDSLNRTYKVHAIPSVGDRIFLGNDGTTDSVVKGISHTINPEFGSHEITVYYGD